MSISKVYKIINDVDELVYIGSTTQILCKRMVKHRESCKYGRPYKLYNHMRNIGVEHFKIILIKEYIDISKERLRKKEDKYIKKYNTVLNGLNNNYSNSSKCIHNISRYACKDCKGNGVCEHNKIKGKCVICGGIGICEHQKHKENCKICSPKQCDICNKIFAGKSCLTRHLKNIHSI